MVGYSYPLCWLCFSRNHLSLCAFDRSSRSRTTINFSQISCKVIVFGCRLTETWLMLLLLYLFIYCFCFWIFLSIVWVIHISIRSEAGALLLCFSLVGLSDLGFWGPFWVLIIWVSFTFIELCTFCGSLDEIHL